MTATRKTVHKIATEHFGEYYAVTVVRSWRPVGDSRLHKRSRIYVGRRHYECAQAAMAGSVWPDHLARTTAIWIV